jgi:hypothetical protein
MTGNRLSFDRDVSDRSSNGTDLLLVMAIVCPESIENFQETALKTAQ